jgi:hypothetical protein
MHHASVLRVDPRQSDRATAAHDETGPSPERAMFPTQITLRNLRPSPELSVRIRDLCEKLGHLHPRILNCRVAIEQPFVRAKRPSRTPPPPAPFFVDVQLRLPGCEIALAPQEDAELDAAIRKAFVLVRRQLREVSVTERETARDHRVATLA